MHRLRRSDAVVVPLPRLFEHGDAVRQPDVLDFSTSLNPLGPPASILTALQRRLGEVAEYPDPRCRLLTQALAESHGLPVEHVAVGNGSSELIDLLARVLRPRRVAIVEPTYTEYLRSSLLAGAEVDHWLPSSSDRPPDPFDPSPAEVVWLCNPNNPTGRLWPEGELRRWIEDDPRMVFIVDEAFLPFRDDERQHSLVPVTRDRHNLVVLRSLTKFLAIPGLRLGYAVGPPELMERVRQHQPPWSVNALAQLAGEAGLADHDFAEQTRTWCKAESPRLYDQLRRLSPALAPFEPSANFILVRLADGLTAGDLRRRLRERHISIRVADNFVSLNDRYFRVAVRKGEDNERLLAELERCLRG